MTAGKLTKSDKLGQVDHSTIDYPPFRRSFYTETGALAKMSDEEVAAYRKELDDIKVCFFVSKLHRIHSIQCAHSAMLWTFAAAHSSSIVVVLVPVSHLLFDC